MEQKSLSVGIVGGGIAGLYCAWKLVQAGHRPIVYECLDRLGGRIETLDLDGFKAECGPMRFECAIQPLFTRLVTEELGLTFAPFTSYKGEKVNHPLYLLQEDEKCQDQIDQETAARQSGQPVTGFEYCHLTSSLDLLKLGVYRMLHPDRRHLTLPEVVEARDGQPSPITAYADACTDKDYDELRSNPALELEGQALSELGFWNALARVLSPNAVTKIRDVGTFYHLMPENPSAPEWAIFWLRGFRSDAQLSTIDDGVATIVERLEAKIRIERPSDPIDLIRNATVRGITRGDTDDKVRLEIEFGRRHEEGSLFRAFSDFDHVILALPQWPLKRLDTRFPRQVRADVDGVIGFPLLKAFLVQERPWWDGNTPAQRGANLVPTRELHYFVPPGAGDDPAIGMVMLYTDRPATAYWQPYVKKPHEQAQLDRPPELRDELVRHLILDLKHFAAEEPVLNPRATQVLHNLQESEEKVLAEETGRVTRFAIRDWTQPPFGAAAHAWAPGVNVVQALERLKAFRLDGSTGPNNLHICGEAYSDYQGFIEGALRSAEAVLATIPAP